MTHVNQILQTAVKALTCALEYASPYGTGEYLSDMIEQYGTRFFKGKVTLDGVKDYAYTHNDRHHIGVTTEYTFEGLFDTETGTRAQIRFKRTENTVRAELVEGSEAPKTFVRRVRDLSSDELDCIRKNSDHWVRIMLCRTDMFRVCRTRRICMNL